MNVAQRAFLAGELAPALYARTDVDRYAFGLRTCRNAVVLPGGGVSKRFGTEFVARLMGGPLTLTIAPATLLLVLGTSDVLTATVHDSDGNVVPGLTVTWETDDATVAPVTSLSALTALVHGLLEGATAIRARIDDLDLVSNDCDVTVYDEYVLHTFTSGSGAFLVTAGSGAVRALIVAGGGSGGSVDGTGVGAGGGGGGGVLDLSGIAVSPGSYPVSIGGGGVAPHADHTIGSGVFGCITGSNGSNSTAFGNTCFGGGGGGGADATISRQGRPGGSGGGGASADDFSPPPGAYDGGAGVGGQGLHGNGGSHSAGSLGGGGGSWPGSTSDISGAAVGYGMGGIGRDGPGNFGSPAGSGNGGEGGGQQLNSDGGNGASGKVQIRYLRSSGIVASGGVITTFPT